MRKMPVLFILTFSIFAFSASCGPGLSRGGFSGADVTGGIEILGTIKDAVPASAGSKIPTHAYARNIWDMQVFDGRIFLGYGSWSNSSPSGAVNAGPLPILALDLDTENMVIEEVYAANGNPELAGGVYVARDEQLWRFKVLGGKLYAPGCDPRAGWELGDLYVRQDNKTWLKKRTIPNGVHCFDLAEFNGKLYAGLDGNPRIMCSDDSGDTWYAPVNNPNVSRVYTLIPWKGVLYGFLDYSHKHLSGYAIDKTNTAEFVNFEPALPEAEIGAKTVKAHAVVGDILAFTLGLNTATEGLNTPGGLFYSRTFPYDNAKAVFPEPGAVPIDIIGRESHAFVLTYAENTDDFTVIVYRTENLDEFEECFRFSYGTFARSFEEHEGEFYFGMGTRDGKGENAPSELAGTIIKIPYAVCHEW